MPKVMLMLRSFLISLKSCGINYSDPYPLEYPHYFDTQPLISRYLHRLINFHDAPSMKYLYRCVRLLTIRWSVSSIGDVSFILALLFLLSIAFLLRTPLQISPTNKSNSVDRLDRDTDHTSRIMYDDRGATICKNWHSTSRQITLNGAFLLLL